MFHEKLNLPENATFLTQLASFPATMGLTKELYHTVS